MHNPSSEPIQPSDILQPLPLEDWPSFDHIVTEDGAPVDNVFSEKQMRLLTEPLYSSWKTDRPFVALANVGLFYGIDIPPLVPDTLLSINVRMPENLFPKLNRSYFVWKYGKPPEVVIEIVSNRQGGEDTRKLELYADVRVANYVIYDPEHYLSDQELRVFRLRGSTLVRDDSRPCQIPEVGLGLTIWQGQFELTDGQWLRWTDSQGELIPTGCENAAIEAQRADQASQRAEQATQRADEIGQENARLRELLRQHNINPG